MQTAVTQKSISRQASYEACLFAIQKAEQLNININVSVADNKGLEMAFLRMENSFIHSIDIAKDKAYTSASFGFPTQQWSTIFKSMPHLEQGFSNRGRLIPFGGGMPIFENGIKIGAIGISGGTEEEDIICAKYAIEKIGLE
ncbi:GlcG/HbpS family heme-binding protein [Halarcobacter anaerophilus]|uniref:Cobalamin adenosyltransferase n=1 Tax=Halarcobacter anaerophilus TaxID=877500 RepID=A0A4Q0XXE0_9BACT|nr:heme-binding protein [Halarcobacter anaerophilus]QDF28740.1 heme-binding protein [Halarcobacter anaerophilus]RXJ61893.1 cobalamin adenosyltransferase [Halarcobacter anaerophilus]